jgi:hypothetical protein
MLFDKLQIEYLKYIPLLGDLGFMGETQLNSIPYFPHYDSDHFLLNNYLQ